VNVKTVLSVLLLSCSVLVNSVNHIGHVCINDDTHCVVKLQCTYVSTAPMYNFRFSIVLWAFVFYRLYLA